MEPAQRLRHPLPGQGFTLPEVLVVMAVLGVLLSLAVPVMSGLRQQHQLQARAEGLLNSLVLARSEALRRQQRVTLCARASASDTACDLSGDWQQGWLVFEDLNTNALRDQGEALIEVHGALPPDFRLTSNFRTGAYVSYGPEGRSLTTHAAFLAGTFSACSLKSQQGWQVVVNAVGKPRLQKYSPSGCP